MTEALSLRHLLLALAVVVVWGSNFVVIKLALDVLPPLLFAALRFTFAFLPALFLLKRPQVPLRLLASYGLLIGVGQFGLLYLAMKRDITPGLAALVVQTQVFFTIALAIWLRGDRLRPFQFAAIGLATLGVAVILLNIDADTTLLGLALSLAAAILWSIGNIVAGRTPEANVVAYVGWSSAFAILPLLVLSALFEGLPAIATALSEADAFVWGAVAWQSLGNTLFGYAAWAWLLARNPAAVIMPMSLLVPVVGLVSSAWWLGEPLQPWKLLATALVLAGLLLNLLWPRLRRR